LSVSDIGPDDKRSVGDCLKDKPRVDYHDNIESILELMKKSQSRVLPVFKGDEFIGTVTESDLVNYLYECSHELKGLRDEYIAVTNLAGEIIVKFDKEGRWTFLNDCGCRFWGRPREQLLGVKFADFVHPEDTRKTKAAIQKVVKTRQMVRGLINRQKTPNGWRTVEWNGAPIFDESQNCCGIRASGKDITQHWQIEAALYESEQKYKTLVSHVPGAVYRCEFNGGRTMKFISGVVKEISGYDFSDFLDNRVLAYSQIIHVNDRKMVEQTIREAVKHKTVYSMEYRIIRADETIRWVREQGQASFAAGRVQWLDGAIFDITERKRFEDELERSQYKLECKVQERTAELLAANKVLQKEIAERHRLEKEILAISERQQQRLGRELHDGLGQLLTGIALTSKVLERNMAAKSLTEAASVAKIARLINQGITQTRNLAKGFYPVDLHSYGLVSALKSLASNMEQLFGISCRFRCEGAVEVEDVSTKIQLYRIAQEAVTNAVKHGKAKNIAIIMSSSGDTAIIKIENDGEEMPAEHGKSSGMGLRIMRYRARVINALLDIRSGAAGGAVVTCTFEKKQADEHRGGELWQENSEKEQIMI